MARIPDEDFDDHPHMLYLGGQRERSFRCDNGTEQNRCGANVFRKHKTLPKYRCNGCGATYTGE